MVTGILSATDDHSKTVEYLRHLIRIQESQGLFEETAETLTRLLELGAASDEEQLQLASLILDTDPLRSAKMLEALAQTREGVDAGRLYFEACYGYCAAEERESTARVIELTMDSGFRQKDVFEQALTLLEGEPRARALTAYLASGGNSAWDLHQNQSIRPELANLHLDYDRGQEALAAADGGLNFGESRDLVQAKERALIQMGSHDALSRWYLAEAERNDSVWDTAELIERVKTASKYYRREEDFETENRALDYLNQRGDRRSQSLSTERW